MSGNTPQRFLAPAKINLSLHVTGRRDDGYHLLDSLVVFADVGDMIKLRAAPDFQFTAIGLPDDVPSDIDNLVMRAARAFEQAGGERVMLHIVLHKFLPVQAGLGGGTSDGATTLRALAQWYGGEKNAQAAQSAAARLGADGPVCFAARPARMRGIGEDVQALAHCPTFFMVLVHPNVACPTRAVFQGFGNDFSSPLPTPPASNDFMTWVSYLQKQENMLQSSAIARVPMIEDVLDIVRRQEGCVLHRMSGSGATCFGIFSTRDLAAQAAKTITAARPHWWVQACQTDGVV